MKDQVLLAVIEVGGYPNFAPLYQRLGYRVEMVPSVRKAQMWLKRNRVDVVVAELCFDPEFRDRMSNLESLLAAVQKYSDGPRVIVFFEEEHLSRLEQVKQRYSIAGELSFPIREEALTALLESSG